MGIAPGIRPTTDRGGNPEPTPRKHRPDPAKRHTTYHTGRADGRIVSAARRQSAEGGPAAAGWQSRVRAGLQERRQFVAQPLKSLAMTAPLPGDGRLIVEVQGPITPQALDHAAQVVERVVLPWSRCNADREPYAVVAVPASMVRQVVQVLETAGALQESGGAECTNAEQCRAMASKLWALLPSGEKKAVR